MRDVQRFGRRTWLARLSGGALAVWAGLKLGGQDGYGIRITAPGRDAVLAHEPATSQQRASEQALTDTLRIPLGGGGFTTAYVLVRGGEATLVDTGTPGSAQRIGEVIQQAGLTWDAIGNVILTHYHSDHTGSVGDVLRLAQRAVVWAGAADIPSIQASRDIRSVADSDEVFGLQILSTPGHTLGHISVFDPAGPALVVGDAATNIGGSLGGSPAQFTADTGLATASVRKLAAVSFDTAWFMHGDPIQGRASDRFQQFSARLEADEPVAHSADPGHTCL